MARTKEFDPDAALTSAMELFWERGYEATSMADLVDHLGIARATMVVNTAVELASRDPAIGRRIAANWDSCETALLSALTRAQAQKGAVAAG